MAQVLAAVPTAGLEAVLVAVDLVIESGALSDEHVLNVVARLNARLGGNHLATDAGAAGQHKPVRQPARRGECADQHGGGQSCVVMSPPNSKNCACTAWWVPGRT